MEIADHRLADGHQSVANVPWRWQASQRRTLQGNPSDQLHALAWSIDLS